MAEAKKPAVEVKKPPESVVAPPVETKKATGPVPPTPEEIKQYLEWSRQIEKQNQFVIHSREIFEASVLVEADLEKRREAHNAAEKALEEQKKTHAATIDSMRREAQLLEGNLKRDHDSQMRQQAETIKAQETKKAKLYDEIAQLVKQKGDLEKEKTQAEASVQPALAAAQKELKAFEDDAAKKKAVLEAELAGLQQAIRNLRGGIERLPSYGKETQKEKEAR
jgi:hypothetical protein